jgi:hypothetical protein
MRGGGAWCSRAKWRIGRVVSGHARGMRGHRKPVSEGNPVSVIAVAESWGDHRRWRHHLGDPFRVRKRIEIVCVCRRPIQPLRGPGMAAQVRPEYAQRRGPRFEPDRILPSGQSRRTAAFFARNALAACSTTTTGRRPDRPRRPFGTGREKRLSANRAASCARCPTPPESSVSPVIPP